MTESEMLIYVKTKTVAALHIVQNNKGLFVVDVELTTTKGRIRLITQRKNNREWSDATRLIEHIKEFYGQIPIITVTPYHP